MSPARTSATDRHEDDLELHEIRAAIAGLAAVFAPRTYGGIPEATIDGYAVALRRFGGAAIREAAASLVLSDDTFPSPARIAETARAASRRTTDQRELLSVAEAAARAEAELRERAARARAATPQLPAPTVDEVVKRASAGVRRLAPRGDEGDVPPPDWRERVRQAMAKPAASEPPADPVS